MNEPLVNESGIGFKGRRFYVAEDRENEGKDDHHTPDVPRSDAWGVNEDLPQGWTVQSNRALEDGQSAMRMTYDLVEALFGLPPEIRVTGFDVEPDSKVLVVYFGAEGSPGGWVLPQFGRIEEARVVVTGFEPV